MIYVIETNLPAIFGLIALIILIISKPMLSKKQSKLFILAIVMNMLMIFLQSADFLFAESDWHYAYLFRRLTSALGYGLYPPIILIIITMFSSKKLHWLYFVPFAVNLCLCIISMPTYIVFKINPENSFGHGPLYFLTIVIPLFYLLLLIIKVIISADYFKETERIFGWILAVSIPLAIFLEIVLGVKFMTWIIISYMLILFYTLAITDYNKFDRLTNLFNRLSFEKYIEKHDHRIAATIVYFDINKFKSMNDLHGHAFGDDVLTKVGTNFKQVFSKVGYVYRIGGDEFILVYLKNKEKLEVLLNDFDKLNKAESLTVAHGAYFMQMGESITDAVNKADAIMYEEKQRLKQH